MSNVAVAAQSRGVGVGRQLVAGAQRAAREVLGAQWVYAHVGVDNEVRQVGGGLCRPAVSESCGLCLLSRCCGVVWRDVTRRRLQRRLVPALTRAHS